MFQEDFLGAIITVIMMAWVLFLCAGGMWLIKMIFGSW